MKFRRFGSFIILMNEAKFEVENLHPARIGDAFIYICMLKNGRISSVGKNE